MSKITITVSGKVGIGKSTLCAKLEILLKHLGCQVEWIDGGPEKNLLLEDWSDMHQTPIEIVERVEKVFDMRDMPKTSLKAVQAIASGDGPCVESDGCPTERAVLQRFWRAHAGHPTQLIDQSKIDELIGRHSEWTPHGYGIVDTHRQKFAADLLSLTSAKAQRREEVETERVVNGAPVTVVETARFPFAHMAEHEPTGFMMKHQLGGARGFSWIKNDLKFNEDWERFGLFTEEQIADALERANEDYNLRARNWRNSFDAMHRRAMKAEGQLAESNELLERLRDALKPQVGFPHEFNTPTIPLEKAMQYAANTLKENE